MALRITILSGGQTGADSAALRFAVSRGIPHGGWCPRGRRRESGVIPTTLHLRETPSPGYTQRTEWNVRDSDGTVILTVADRLSGGSKKTAQFARKYGKPWLHLAFQRTDVDHAAVLRRFIRQHRIRNLNVAGSRRSQEPSVGKFVTRTLQAAWRERRSV